VFPRQDERLGEAVACALVVVSTPLRLGSVTDWCQQQGLATYKRPRYLFMVDSLPRNSSGKVLKHKLIDMFGRIQRSKL
jgi:non-ribosomal peptide synthetase component E (peptide arylation enzyme)